MTGEEEEEVDSEGDVDGESDVEDIDDEENAELRKKIEQALKINGIERAEESDSGSSSEEELLDDDQMMQFDEKLAEVFRLRKNEKTGKGYSRRALSVSFCLTFCLKMTLSAKHLTSRTESSIC